MVSLQDGEIIEEMFVQVARRMQGDADSISLLDLAPTTLYFSDRPERVVGHMTTAQFVDSWSNGEDCFADNPPNAVLSYLQDDADAPEEVVVVLSQPAVGTDSIRYGIEILEGEIPRSAGPCTLFIDPLGRPLSPGSIEGMRRREYRRNRRRML